jgi:hypothetical protein
MNKIPRLISQVSAFKGWYALNDANLREDGFIYSL